MRELMMAKMPMVAALMIKTNAMIMIIQAMVVTIMILITGRRQD